MARLGWCAAVLVVVAVGYAATKGPEAPAGTTVAPGSGSLREQLKAAVEQARETKLAPIALVTATWCVPCQQLKASMDDPLMRDAFGGAYVIQMDFDAWKSELGEAGFTTSGIPALFRLGEDGRPVAMINGGAWAENIPKNMAPPLKWFIGGWETAKAAR